MVKIKGKAWAAKRGLLQAESRTPGQIEPFCANSQLHMLTQPHVRQKAVRPMSHPEAFVIWVGNSAVAIAMNLLPNIVCHLKAMQAPAEA